LVNAICDGIGSGVQYSSSCHYGLIADIRQWTYAIGTAEVKLLLEQLAVKGHVAASTQHQALNALVFLYQPVLDQPRDALDSFTRANRPRRLPGVLTRSEARALRAQLERIQG
jgi:hypothetical protein